MDPAHHDRFLLRQRIRPVINQYEFSLLGPDGEPEGEPFCFVEQKRFKLKEDIRFYTDERKTVGFLPEVGGLADWLPIPYHFNFLRDDQILGTHTRKAWKWRDTYTIDMSGDPDRTVDRRLVFAIAVGMDALQAR